MTALAPGARVGDYVLVARAGTGASSEVWRAEHVASRGIPVALKLVRVDRSNGVTRELAQLKALSHPSIVKCFGSFWNDPLRVFVLELEWVDGVTLDRLADEPRFSEAHRLWLLHHVAHALAYLHAMGVIHRDLKPANILVSRHFFAEPSRASGVRLVDFGVAGEATRPITNHDGIEGTLAYLDPELILGGSGTNTPARDVFAFGVIGWELLRREHPLGSLPHRGDVEARHRWFAAAYAEVREGRRPYPKTDTDEVLALLAGCLALDPYARPESAAEVARRLDDAAPGVVASVRPAGATQVSRPVAPPVVASPGHLVVLALGVLVAALAALVIGVAVVVIVASRASAASTSPRTDGTSVCRLPVPEVRPVNPPGRSPTGALRSGKSMLTTLKEDVKRGEYVTVQGSEQGDDGECWYRVKVNSSGNVGWMHRINVP